MSRIANYVVQENLDGTFSLVLFPEGYEMGTYRGKDAERRARRDASYRNEAIDQEDMEACI